MGLLDIYSAVNGERVEWYGASDAAVSSAPGVVSDKVRDCWPDGSGAEARRTYF